MPCPISTRNSFGKVAIASVILTSAILVYLNRNFTIRWPAVMLQSDSETRKTDELQNLSAEMRTKIWNLQHPENCDEARILVFHLNWWPNGLGSILHVTLQHFFLAFFTNRTFVLLSNGWSYDRKGWEHYFMPLGNCSFDGKAESLPVFSDKTPNVRIVRNSDRNPTYKYDWIIPRDILVKIKKIHSDPYVWWVGQFINYMLRFQPWFAEVLESKSKIVSLPSYAVGFHIRWGDKIAYEADKHPVSEYMNFAKKWFERPEHQGLRKTVYIATEQSAAWKDLENNYREFSFIGAGYVNQDKELDYRKGTNYAQRKNELEAILTDIYFLSKCHYVVCTLTSNVCRLLYEIMAAKRTEPQNAIQSLDATFYWLMSPLRLQAIEDHDAKNNNMGMKTGDTFTTPRGPFIIGSGGYVTVKSNRTGRTGRVPMNKLKGIMEPLEFG